MDNLSAVMDATPADGGVAEDFMSSVDTAENRIESPSRESSEPSTPEEAEQETPAAEGEVAESPFPAELFKGVTPEVAELMRAAAANGEYDINDPILFKAVRQIAEKELRIRETSKAAEPGKEAQTYLDAFRDTKPVRSEPANGGAAPAPTAATPAPAAPAIPRFIEIANKWQDPRAEAYHDVFASYEIDDTNPDKPAQWYDTQVAVQDRVFHEHHKPLVGNMIMQTLYDVFGPELEEVFERREERFRHSIVSTLAKQPGFEDVMDLFSPTGRGEAEHDGKKFSDTWINHIFSEFPELLQTVEKGSNENETKRLTTAKIYTAAHRLMKAQRAKETTDPRAVKAAVKAGMAIEQSKRDPARTALNSGATGSPSGSRDMDDIFGEGNKNSLESLFSK